ncbi:MAG: hypothetical protein HY911_02580 [Desulfobacterales bacterium]|nr:hypothetical protein [Desulfobacterales bacterium]
MKTLGIFVISDRHVEYVFALAQAAHLEGLMVCVHLLGSGVRLVRQAAFGQLAALARISICSESAEFFQVDRQLAKERQGQIVPAGEMARILRRCDRHLFI